MPPENVTLIKASGVMLIRANSSARLYVYNSQYAIRLDAGAKDSICSNSAQDVSAFKCDS